MEDKEDVADRIAEYQTFVDQVLRPELQTVQRSAGETVQELKDYNDLVNRLHRLEPLAQVDLGHQKVFCQAEFDPDNIILVHVGMGFHVELTIPEAVSFCSKRIQFLEHVLETKRAKVKRVEEHLESSSLILQELSKQIGR
mmetsp:Transcript_19551/g.53834  ORF Transcript_19551/g.53834 Transcript_19551/m.53834 type:complete len:141 (+) Transcript_19551:4360-4782(+)